jgi:hypothetical protein
LLWIGTERGDLCIRWLSGDAMGAMNRDDLQKWCAAKTFSEHLAECKCSVCLEQAHISVLLMILERLEPIGQHYEPKEINIR